MCVNTLIKCIENERLRCFGYCYLKSIKPRHWFQFADDTAIVTATVEDNQLLLNVFARWCSWAGLSINVKKCSTFGIKKSGSKSTQFKGTVSPAERCDFVCVKLEKVHELFQVCRICGKGVVFYNMAQYGLLHYKCLRN